MEEILEKFNIDKQKLNILNSTNGLKVKVMEEYAKEHTIPILRPNTASLLKSLVAIKQPKKILEIGTAIGYSGTLMLENSVGSKLDTIEKLAKNAKVAKENFKNLGLSDRVKIFEGDAKEILKELIDEYDFIFLDGPKGQYARYLPDLVRLLAKDGILFSDNVLYRNMVLSGQFIPRKKRAIVNNLEQFLDEISNHDKLSSQIIDLEDGVSISIKNK